MITTPTLAPQPARRLARRRAAVTRVMGRAMTRPTSTVASATTRHTTRREVTGRGADARRDGRTEVERARVHAHARCSKRTESIWLDKYRLCVDGGASSLDDPPGLMRPKKRHFPLYTAIDEGGSRRALVSRCVITTNTRGSTAPNARKPCKLTFVRFLGHNDPTFTQFHHHRGLAAGCCTAGFLALETDASRVQTRRNRKNIRPQEN